MANIYANDLTDITASFPTTVYSPQEFKPADGTSYAVVDESFSVPASSPYIMQLDLVPYETGFNLRINGTQATVIPWGESPALGQVALSWDSGFCSFNSGDASKAVLATYTGRGTSVSAYSLMKIGKELAAAQNEIDTNTIPVIGTSTDNAVVRWNGTSGNAIQNSSVIITDANAINVGAGTTSLPSISFSGDTDTGLYSASANTIGVICGTSVIATFNSSGLSINSGQLLAGDGSVGTPSLSFSTNTDTGIYLSASEEIVFSLEATAKLTLATSTLTLAGRYIAGSNGAAATPTFTTSTQAGVTGLYFSAANNLDISCGGAQIANYSSTGLNMVAGGISTGGNSRLTSSGITYSTVGSAAGPSISFYSDTDTGFYRPGTNQIGASTGGTIRAIFSSGGFEVSGSGQMFVPLGSVTVPGYTFTGDANTGIYSTGADNISITAGGVQRASFASAISFTSGDSTTGSNISFTTGNGSTASGGNFTITCGSGDIIGGGFTFGSGVGGTKDGSVVFNMDNAVTEAGDFSVNNAYDIALTALNTISLTGNTTILGTLSVTGVRIDASGYFKPLSSTDSAASNSSLYYSTTASKLVWKDSSGVVNNLY